MIFKEKHGRYRHDDHYDNDLSSSAGSSGGTSKVLPVKYTDHHSRYEIVAIMRKWKHMEKRCHCRCGTAANPFSHWRGSIARYPPLNNKQAFNGIQMIYIYIDILQKNIPCFKPNSFPSWQWQFSSFPTEHRILGLFLAPLGDMFSPCHNEA
jgi:hypothetical protein